MIFIMNGTGLTQGREELVRLDTIEMVYGKKKNDKEARMASIKKGIDRAKINKLSIDAVLAKYNIKFLKDCRLYLYCRIKIKQHQHIYIFRS